MSYISELDRERGRESEKEKERERARERQCERERDRQRDRKSESEREKGGWAGVTCKPAAVKSPGDRQGPCNSAVFIAKFCIFFTAWMTSTQRRKTSR